MVREDMVREFKELTRSWELSIINQEQSICRVESRYKKEREHLSLKCVIYYSLLKHWVSFKYLIAFLNGKISYSIASHARATGLNFLSILQFLPLYRSTTLPLVIYEHPLQIITLTDKTEHQATLLKCNGKENVYNISGKISAIDKIMIIDTKNILSEKLEV